MSFLDQLERKLGRYAIPDLSLYLVIGQVAALLLNLFGVLDLRLLVLQADLVRQGEWWRLFACWFMPPSPGLFGYAFTAFSWYMFYLMGNALEHHWGVFRYNLFLLLGWALTVAVSFLTPGSAATNLFVGGSVFLAFEIGRAHV